KRIESCQALSSFMERRTELLRRDARDGWFRIVPFACRAFSQLNNSRAWRADSFLTFLTASSTALMWDKLLRILGRRKRVLCPANTLQQSHNQQQQRVTAKYAKYAKGGVG